MNKKYFLNISLFVIMATLNAMEDNSKFNGHQTNQLVTLSQEKQVFGNYAHNITNLPSNIPFKYKSNLIQSPLVNEIITGFNALRYHQINNIESKGQHFTQTHEKFCDLDPLIVPLKKLIEPEIYENFEAQQHVLKRHNKKFLFGAAFFGFLLHPFIMPTLKNGFSSFLNNCAQRLHVFISGAANQR